MPATGPGVASVRASVPRATIRQAIDRRLAHASEQARRAVSVAAMAVQTRLALSGSQISSPAYRSVPINPESDHIGGRPSVARPPTRPARQTQTVKRQSHRVADQGHEHHAAGNSPAAQLPEPGTVERRYQTRRIETRPGPDR